MLTIKSVHIENFCQHEELDIEFPNGLIGLIGANGRGKSNCANAIRGALTGKFERHTGDVAANCIRQGQDNNAVVTVYGCLGNTEFKLRREITPKTIKHRLWLDEELYSEKANDIELWLTEASGLTPAIMSEFMFIRQQEIYAFLDATDTERSKKFTALCGTKIYEKLRDDYLDMLKTDKAKFETVNETIIEQLEQQIIAQKEKVQDLDNILANGGKDIERLGDKKKHLQDLETEQSALEQCRILRQWVEKIDDTKRRIQVQTTDWKTETDALKTAKEKLNAVKKDIANLTKDFNSTEEAIKYYKEAEKYFEGWDELVEEEKKIAAKYEKAGKALEEATAVLTQQPVDARLTDKIYAAQTAYIQNQLTTLERSLAVGKEKEQPLIQLVETLNSLGDERGQQCPLCKADKEHWQIPLQSLKEQLANIRIDNRATASEIKDCTQERQKLDERKKQYDECARKREECKRECDRLQEEKEKIAEMLEQYGSDKFTFTDEDEGVFQKLQDLLRNEEMAAKEVLLRKGSHEKSQMQLDELRLALGDQKKQAQKVLDACTFRKAVSAAGSIDSLDVTSIDKVQSEINATLKKIQSSIEEVEYFMDQFHKTQGSRDEAAKHLASLQERLDDAKTQIAASGDMTKWFEYCDKALAWLRKDGLPKLVHTVVLKHLCSVVNEELMFFGKPFEVEVSEDLAFIAKFEDERVIPSKALSGGQKVMLAISFWSSIQRIFAKNLGVMILDEPSDGLDQENSDKLYEVLDRWRQLLHARKQQIVIITHSENLLPVFDKVISL